MPLTRDEDIADLLRKARTIAMIGASDRPDRASHGVMKFLQDQGYRVYPVNPRITGEHVHGEFVWRELCQIGEHIDIVDIFRNSAERRRGGRRGDRGRRGRGVDAAWRDRRGSGGAGRSGGAQGGDGPLPEDRDCAAGGWPDSDGLKRSPPSFRAPARSGCRCRGGRRGRWRAQALANMSIRFDAMVISATGPTISPPSIRNPAAPRL